MKKMLALLLAVMMMCTLFLGAMPIASAEETANNVVMAYTTPNGTYGNASWVGYNDNSLHLAYSKDAGQTWTKLNDGKGILYYSANTSRTNASMLQFCDPYIFQRADGKYVLLATALRYNQAHSNTQVIYWDSDDMVKWSNQKLITLGGSGVYPAAPQVFANEDGTYSIVWKQYNTNNVFVNIASADFKTVGSAAAYEGTAYPQAYPAGVSVANAPTAGTVGCVIPVSEDTIDALVASYGTPAEVPTGTENITVNTTIGTPAVLPATAKVSYADGSVKDVNVTWEEQTPAQYNADGTYTVTGFIEGGAAYLNPFHKNGGDPDIFKGPDGYYYYTSSYMDPEHSGTASYQYDRVNIRRATTINGLATAEDRTIFWRTASGTGSYHLWAPEIHYVQFEGEEQGTWVVYFASGLSNNTFYLNNYALVCDSQDPMTGNWSEPIIMKAPNQTTNFDIDSTVFEFYGKWYRIDSTKSGTAKIAISELTSITTVDDQVILASPEYSFENCNDRVLEGPTVMRANGFVYLCYAAGSTDSTYCLGLMMAKDDPSTNLKDPAAWTRLPYPIMISNRATNQYGPGHATFTVSEDGSTPLLSYMTRPVEAYNNNPLYVANRWARMAVVYFREDGSIYLAEPPADGYIPGSTVTATVNVELTGDVAELKALAADLTIPNADNIKGNITLPTQFKGANVTWTSSNEAVVSTAVKVNENYDDGPAGFVTRQSSDTKVTLIATLEKGGVTYSKGIELTVKAAVKPITSADTDYYLEMYFTDPTHDIFFATAEDGFNYKVLNNNKPIFSTQGHTAVVSQILGDKGLRDPFMMRSKEGDKYYILATDLNASGGSWGTYATRGSDSLVLYESDDLVNWEEGRLIPVATDPNFGCTWAPEVSYDEMTGEYLIYFSIHDIAAGKKQVYYVKTRDYVTFTEPKVWVPYWNGYTTGVIDTTCYYDEATDTYYRFTKNEQNNRPFVDINVGGNLLDDNWVRGTSLTISGTGNYALEGQNMFKLHPNDVPEGYADTVLLIDEYSGSNRGFVPFVTKGLSPTEPITFEIAPSYTKPSGAKHGNVIPVTEAEYNALMEAYGPSPIPDADITSPVAYYSFDDAQNLGASSDGLNDLTAVNSPAYAEEGVRNGAAYLAGGSSSSTTAPYFQFPAGLTKKDEFTVAGWFKIDNNAQWARMIDIGGGQGNTMFLTNNDGDSKLHLDLNISNNYDQITAAPLAAGEWAHIAMSVDGENYYLFVNGKQVGSASLGSRKLSSLDGRKSYIGKSQYSDNYFNGWVDELYFYDQALSPNNLAQLMSEKDINLAAPVAYYSFDNAAKLGASADGLNDLTEVNAPAFTAQGHNNGAAYLAGGAASSTTAPYFKFPAGMTKKDVFTMTGWFKVDNNAQWARMIDIGGGQGNTMFLTNNDGDGKLHLDLNISNNYDQITVDPIPAGEWVYLTIVVDGEYYNLYVNGKLAGTAALGTRKLSSLNGNNSYIGKSQYSDNYYNGWVDELYFYDQALSPLSIAQLMNKASSEVIIYWEDYDAAVAAADAVKANEDYYTAESYAAFLAALPAALDKEATNVQATVDAATAAINAAIAKLAIAPVTAVVSVNGAANGEAAVVVNEDIEVIFKAPAGAAKAAIQAETGKWVSVKSAEVIESNGATDTWKAVFAVGTKGTRALSIFLNYGEGLADSGLDINVTVNKAGAAPVQPKVIEIVEAPAEAAKNAQFQIKVKANAAAEKLGIFNEKGAGVSKTVTYKSIDAEGNITWTLSLAVGSAGERTYQVKTQNLAGEWVDGASFSIVINK